MEQLKRQTDHPKWLSVLVVERTSTNSLDDGIRGDMTHPVLSLPLRLVLRRRERLGESDDTCRRVEEEEARVRLLRNHAVDQHVLQKRNIFLSNSTQRRCTSGSD